MNQEIKLKADKRTETGSVAARRLRRQGWLPGVVKWKSGESTDLKMDRHLFEVMLQGHMSEHLMVNLAIGEDKEPRRVLLREVQHDIIDGRVIHVDFGEVSMTEKMHVEIPLTLRGEPEGVKNQGGVLEQQLFNLEVACLPDDLRENFEIDVSALNIGDTVTVEEMTLGDKYDVLTALDVVVATVSAPRKEVEPEGEEAEGDGEGRDEPELIGRKEDSGEE